MSELKINEKEYLLLIKTLLMFDTSDNNEEIMHDFICNILTNSGFYWQIDNFKNIYAVRGTAKSYPLLNAHMDIVKNTKNRIDWKSYFQQKESCLNCYYYDICDNDMSRAVKDSKEISDTTIEPCVFFENKYKTKKTINTIEIIKKEFELKYNKTTGIINSNNERAMGGDDKCGIAIALYVAMNTEIPMKILFTSQEEIGCVGMSNFEKKHKKWLKNLKYSITLDRRDFGQILLNSSGKRNCSNNFGASLVVHALNNDIIPSFNNGSVADVLILRKYCEAVNLSVCYYEPHSITEYVNFKELMKTTKWVRDILHNI